MPERRYPVQVRDIRGRDVDHEHIFCVRSGDRYLCPVPGCWWNGEDGDA